MLNQQHKALCVDSTIKDDGWTFEDVDAFRLVWLLNQRYCSGTKQRAAGINATQFISQLPFNNMKSGTYVYSLLSRLQREGLSMKWLQGKNRDLSIIILSPDLTNDWTSLFQVWYLLDQSP